MDERVLESELHHAARQCAVMDRSSPSSILDAHSAAHAVALLGMHGPLALPIAKGEDLLELLQDGVLRPRVLVNLATAPDLARIERRPGGVSFGAMVTLDRLIERRGDLPDVLVEAIEQAWRPSTRATLGGDLLQRPQCKYFRNPATTCFKKGGATCPPSSATAADYPGSLYPGLCHAAHASQLAPALIALDAQAEIVTWDGVRRQPLATLYRDAPFNRDREAQLAQDELLSGILVPEATSPAQGFAKVPTSGTAIAVAVVLSTSAGLIEDARIISSGVAPGPFAFDRARDLLSGRRARTVDAARMAEDLVHPDSRLPVASRAASARTAIERALTRALQKA